MAKKQVKPKAPVKVKTQGDPNPLPACPAGYRRDPVTKECVADPG